MFYFVAISVFIYVSLIVSLIESGLLGTHASGGMVTITTSLDALLKQWVWVSESNSRTGATLA